MNRDFAEMLSALSEAGAEFIVVGAHALAAHGTPRATGDLDIWVNPTSDCWAIDLVKSRLPTAIRGNALFAACGRKRLQTDLSPPRLVSRNSHPDSQKRLQLSQSWASQISGT